MGLRRFSKMFVTGYRLACQYTERHGFLFFWDFVYF